MQVPPTRAFAPLVVISWIFHDGQTSMTSAWKYWAAHKAQFPSNFVSVFKKTLEQMAKLDVQFSLIYEISFVIFVCAPSPAPPVGRLWSQDSRVYPE